MWVAVVIAAGAVRDPGPGDLVRFGWAECPGGCPTAVVAKDRAMGWMAEVQASAGRFLRYGQEHQYRVLYSDACRRVDVWIAAAAATDPTEPQRRFWLTRLRALLGPANYQLGMMPAPVPGEVAGWD